MTEAVYKIRATKFAALMDTLQKIPLSHVILSGSISPSVELPSKLETTFYSALL